MNKTKPRSQHNSQHQFEATAAIRELVFEILDIGQTKLLFAVADSDVQSEFNRQLVRECTRNHIPLRTVEAREIKAATLLSYLIDRAGKGGVLSVLGLSRISSANRLKLFASLNFHRDAILELPLSLVIWLTPDLVFHLAAQAPDLWSRRTSVFHLSPKSPEILIRKLFQNSPIPRETWTGKDALSECLEDLLSKESQLAQCQALVSEVDVSRAKNCQVALLEFSEKLLRAALSDRKVELSLWLWNLASVDTVLQSWLAKLSADDRQAFESMYLDRNEILLSLAEKMPEIVNKYKTQIQKNLSLRKSASLLSIFIDYADKELNKISDQLHFVIHPHEHGFLDAFDPRNISGSLASEVTAEELEKWLSGITRKRPSYLDQLEGQLLKDLYNGKPVLEEANRFGATEERIFNLIENLEMKMRLILGASSKLRRPPTSTN